MKGKWNELGVGDWASVLYRSTLRDTGSHKRQIVMMSGPASGPKSLTEVKVLMVQVKIWSMCDTDM